MLSSNQCFLFSATCFEFFRYTHTHTHIHTYIHTYFGKKTYKFSFVSEQISVVQRRYNVHRHRGQLFSYNVVASEGTAVLWGHAFLQTRASPPTLCSATLFTCGCAHVSVVTSCLVGYIFSSTTSGNYSNG